MKALNTTLLLITSMMIGKTAFCQPSNDLCSNATNIGALPIPAACPSGMGAIDTMRNQSNVGATATYPYPSSGACMVHDTSSLPKDVWYRYQATGDTAYIRITGATFANPQITVWLGGCGLTATVACTSGAADTAFLSFPQNIDSVYYVQVSGLDSTQTGTFDLSIQNNRNCTMCLVSGYVVATPPPVNGIYSPGQTVTFCVTITDWVQINDNWFHGLQPTFGQGWDSTTFVPVSDATSCDGNGRWLWYPLGIFSTGDSTWWPAGFYYDATDPNGTGGPGNNYGDDCTSHNWTFCMKITVKQNITIGTDLSATFNTTADGQSGGWSSLGCENDTPVVFHATSGCGPGSNLLNKTICQGDSFLYQSRYLTQAGTYIDTAVIIPGCDTLITTLVLSISTPILASAVSVPYARCQGIDDGSITVSASGGTPPYSYVWDTNPADTTIIGGISALASGNYCVTVYDVNGCSADLCDSVGTDLCPVWPGDADDNRVVDNYDLLPIGLGYDSTGPARVVPGIVWQADAAAEWTDTFTGYTPAINYYFADCNGDGIINADDTLAIVQNFSLTHAKTGSIGSPWRSNIPALYAIPSSDTLYDGDILTVTFVLGSAAIPVANFYGLAFTYNFDPYVVDSFFTNMTFGNSWIGTARDKISINKMYNSEGQIKSAVTRIDHTSQNGNGAIATASFRITTANLSQYSSPYYYTNIGTISGIKAIDQYGNPIQLNAGADTSQVSVVPLGITEAGPEAISIYPSPTCDRVTITTGDIIQEISVTDLLGQEIINSHSLNNSSAIIDMSAFASGIYTLQVKTAKGTGTVKLVVER